MAAAGMTDFAARVAWADPGDAAAVAERVARELALPGPRRIAVPGGSTPQRIFSLLASRGLDWSATTVVLTDDRQIPDDHPASNFGKLQAALGTSGATLARLHQGDRVPPFDLVWLGMGEDGHVASLFPRMAVAGEGEGARVIATLPEPLPPEAPFARLSLNLAALVQAGEIILVVTGPGKRQLLERVIAGDAGQLPVARLLRAAQSPVTIYWS
jgi:6-phosphogluconolactonase